MTVQNTFIWKLGVPQFTIIIIIFKSHLKYGLKRAERITMYLYNKVSIERNPSQMHPDPLSSH